MGDDLNFVCQDCGKSFPADPDSMIEITWSPEVIPRAEAGDDYLTADVLRELSADELRQVGLTKEARDKMLAGEDVACGALCICAECQDRLASEQHP